MRKYLSIILVFTLIFTYIPFGNFVNATNTVTTDSKQNAESTSQKTDKVELVEERTEVSKTFDNLDGTFSTEISQVPIHYQNKDGKWLDIDNELKVKNQVVQNTANSFLVEFDKTETNDLPGVQITEDSYQLNLELKETNNQSIEQARPVNGQIKDNQITYEQIFQDISAIYTVGENYVKEDIVLHEIPENGVPEKFTYQLDLTGLTYKNIDNKIYLYDLQTNELIYVLEAPYMYDAFLPEGFQSVEGIDSVPEEAKSYDIELKARKENQQLFLDLIPNQEWITAKERQYPVVIDPMLVRVTAEDKTENVTDTTIRSNFPTTTGGNDKELGVGTASDGNIVRSFLKFDLTSIPYVAHILSADINLYLTSTNSSSKIDIGTHTVLSEWSENEANWTKTGIGSVKWKTVGGDFATNAFHTVSNIGAVNSNIKDNLYKWTIPEVTIEKWVSNKTNNKGLVLKSAKEETKIYKKFASSESAEAIQYKPKLVVTYKTPSRLGLEDYWDYSANEISSGTQYTNLGTLNNIFQTEDFTLFNNADFNLTFKRTYNSKDYEKSALGNGWTFTGAEKLFVNTGTKKTDIEYKDEDGTVHVFQYNAANNIYKKPKGFDSILKKVSESIYTITSREGIVSNFIIKESYGDTDVKVAYITEKKDTNNNKFIYSYDSTNKLTSVYSNEDSINQRIDFTYNTYNQISLISRKNDVIEFKYDSKNNLIFTDKKLDNVSYMTSKFIYDENNLMTEINENGVLTTTFEYNNYDLKSQKLSSDTASIFYTLDRTNKIATQINPLGDKTILTLNEDYIVTSIDQKNGKITSYELDDENRIIKEKTVFANQDSYFKEFEYDVAGNLIGTKDSDGVTTVNKYDAKNNLIEEINEHQEKTSYKYDTKSNLIQKIDSNDNFVSYIYDNLGDLLEVRYSNGNVESYLYDKSNGYTTIDYINGELNIKYTKVFDKNGNLVSSIDETGKKNTYKYNTENELASVTDNLGTTSYEYDSQGNITKITNPNKNTKEYGYNQKELKISETDALGNTIYYEYNDDDTLKRVINPNSNSVITYKSITNNDSFTESKVLENGVEKFTTIESGLYTTHLNNLTGYKTEYKRFNNGLLESVTFNDKLASKINYTYDIDLLSSIEFHDELYTFTSENARVSSAKLNDSPLFNIVYNSNADLKMETVYGSIGAGIQNSYSEKNQQLKQQVLKSKFNTIYDTYNYEYNDFGKLIAYTSNWGRISYKYDENDQLVEEKLPNNQIIKYSYDKLGNRISKVENNSITTYEYNENNQIKSSDYSYDANGNMTKNGAFTYHWNAFNQLVKVVNNNTTIANYEYDIEGRRVYSKINGIEKYYRYDGETDYLLYEENKDGSERKSYTYDADGYPLTMVYNDQVYYYLTNYRGDVLALLDSKGNVVAEYTYDSWGNILSQKDLDNQVDIDISMENPYRYAGYRYDNESNLYYLLGRYYNPDAGVFLSRDPYIGDLVIPKSMHGYIYADNNPVMNVDPNGERAAKAIYYVFMFATKKLVKSSKKASLIWKPDRMEHVRLHEKNNKKKPKHGVFYEDSIVTTNKAWGKKGAQKPVIQKNKRLAYKIYYKNAGYQGGYKGDKRNLNHIKTVVKPDGRTVVTSYPE